MDPAFVQVSVAPITDMHLAAGSRPWYRSAGNLQEWSEAPVFSAADTAAFCRRLLPREERDHLLAEGYASLTLRKSEFGGMRIHAIRHADGSCGVVVRFIDGWAPTFSDLARLLALGCVEISSPRRFLCADF